MNINVSVKNEDKCFSQFTFSDEESLPSMIIEMQAKEAAIDKLKSLFGLLRMTNCMEKKCQNVSYEMDISKRTLTFRGNLPEALEVLRERKEISDKIYRVICDEDETDIKTILQRAKEVTLPEQEAILKPNIPIQQQAGKDPHESMESFLNDLRYASPAIQKECTEELSRKLEKMGLPFFQNPPTNIKVGKH